MIRVQKSLHPKRVAATAALVLTAAAGVQAQQVGHPGPSFQGVHSPSGAKSESKLWWNDGAWWGCMWSRQAGAYTIHRLDLATHTWSSTGTAVDLRGGSHGDCLWDGAKLYISAHEYTDGVGAPGGRLDVFRFGYDPNADVYSLDPGFPVLIGDSATEVLTIDKDASGTLWAAWMSSRRVWYSHTIGGNDRAWSLPALHPGTPADLSGDDICQIVSFQQGARIGLMWSDQLGNAFRFSFHDTGTAGTAWSPVETAAAAPLIADDHISMRASNDGRLFVAVKTTSNEVLMLRRGATGAWARFTVATAADHWTRPLLLLDEQAHLVHVFATRPVVAGTIVEKTSPMDLVQFPTGIGTPVIRDAAGPAFNDATSTKQSVSGATGLVVLASNVKRNLYGHHHDPLGGPVASAPTARIHVSSTRAQPTEPLQFLDGSTGAPTTWLWQFGDGSTSNLRHPKHAYAQTGTFTVQLTVTNGLGSNTQTRTNLITVQQPATALVLKPIEDGHVRELTPNRNYGSLPEMRVRRTPGESYHSYVKFFVPPGPMRISSATLRLFCTDGGTDGGTLHPVGRDWSETGFNWWTAPPLTAASVGSIGDIATGASVDVNLSTVVTHNGTAAFGIDNLSTNSIFYSTRESANPPELRLTLQFVGGPPVARFESSQRFGAVRKTVQFFDTSDGVVTAWLWNFGDGSTSTVQNPSHTFAAPGRYTVSLRATNAQGSHTQVETDYVEVVPPPDGASKPTGDDTALPTPVVFPVNG